MYEVQTYTICDGWVNTWQDNGKPITFKSFGKAVDAIDEHLADLEANGMEEDRNTYRIKHFELQGKK